MSRASRRYYRTVLLGVAALGGLVWSAHVQFDIPLRDIAELSLGATVAVLLVILAAGVCVALALGLRKLFSTRRRRDR